MVLSLKEELPEAAWFLIDILQSGCCLMVVQSKKSLFMEAGSMAKISNGKDS